MSLSKEHTPALGHAGLGRRSSGRISFASVQKNKYWLRPWSMLFSSTVADADEYAELFDAEVRRLLDLSAPLGTSRRRGGQRDNRSLSEEARHARYVVDSSVGTIGLDFHQTSRPTDDAQLPVAE